MQDFNQILKEMKALVAHETMHHKQSLRDHVTGVVNRFWDEHYDKTMDALTIDERTFITWAQDTQLTLRREVVEQQAVAASSALEAGMKIGDEDD